MEREPSLSNSAYFIITRGARGPHPIALSAAYSAVAQGIRELHELALLGKNDSAEADAVRDRMDAPWEALSGTERQRLSGLSEDLYSISEATSVADAASASAISANHQVPEALDEAFIDRLAMIEVHYQGRWDEALEWVRDQEKTIPSMWTNLLRGLIWREIGDLETARLFFRRFDDLKGDNPKHHAHCLSAAQTIVRTLQESDRDTRQRAIAV